MTRTHRQHPEGMIVNRGGSGRSPTPGSRNRTRRLNDRCVHEDMITTEVTEATEERHPCPEGASHNKSRQARHLSVALRPFSPRSAGRHEGRHDLRTTNPFLMIFSCLVLHTVASTLPRHVARRDAETQRRGFDEDHRARLRSTHPVMMRATSVTHASQPQRALCAACISKINGEGLAMAAKEMFARDGGR